MHKKIANYTHHKRMQFKTTMRYCLSSIKLAKPKSLIIQCVGMSVGEKALSYCLWEYK